MVPPLGLQSSARAARRRASRRSRVGRRSGAWRRTRDETVACVRGWGKRGEGLGAFHCAQTRQERVVGEKRERRWVRSVSFEVRRSRARAGVAPPRACACVRRRGPKAAWEGGDAHRVLAGRRRHGSDDRGRKRSDPAFSFVRSYWIGPIHVGVVGRIQNTALDRADPCRSGGSYCIGSGRSIMPLSPSAAKRRA